MEIDITEFFENEDPCLYCASRAELGDQAGQITWRNACNMYEQYDFLDTEEKKDEFREHISEYGAWSDVEITSWTDTELNALFIQEISTAMREKEHYDNWYDYKEASGRIYPGDNKKVYIYIGM